ICGARAPRIRISSSGGSGGGQDVDDFAALALAELHLAVGEGEQRVVAAAADVLTRVHARTALADDDRAGRDRRAVERLHAEALGVGVPPVAGGAATLGLRHRILLALRDLGDLDGRVLLAVAVAAALVRAALVDEPVDLRALRDADDLGRHRRPFELGRRG